MQQDNSGNQVLNDQMESCIQDCLNAHTVSLDGATQAMQQAGAKADLIRTMLDCSEICLASAHFMIRNSRLYGYVCQACASICTDCGELAFEAGMNDVGNACRACAESCNLIVKMVV